MAYVIPNFRIETKDNENANTDESLLDILLKKDMGIEKSAEEHLMSVKEMFDYAAPEGQTVKSMVYEPPKKNGMPTYH